MDLPDAIKDEKLPKNLCPSHFWIGETWWNHQILTGSPAARPNLGAGPK